MYVFSGEDWPVPSMGRGKVGPLKKLEKNPRLYKVFMQLDEEWNLKTHAVWEIHTTCEGSTAGLPSARRLWYNVSVWWPWHGALLENASEPSALLQGRVGELAPFEQFVCHLYVTPEQPTVDNARLQPFNKVTLGLGMLSQNRGALELHTTRAYFRRTMSTWSSLLPSTSLHECPMESDCLKAPGQDYLLFQMWV